MKRDFNESIDEISLSMMLYIHITIHASKMIWTWSADCDGYIVNLISIEIYNFSFISFILEYGE